MNFFRRLSTSKQRRQSDTGACPHLERTGTTDFGKFCEELYVFILSFAIEEFAV
jgi:hypothetical protein